MRSSCSAWAGSRDARFAVALRFLWQSALFCGGGTLEGLLAGIAAAAALQSSSAVVGIALGLAREGLITLPAGVIMVIGADLGTCSTALLASIGMEATARRAAWFHFFYNLISLILALSFYPYLIKLAVISAGTLPRRLANAHLLYNLLGAAILLPLLTPLARFAGLRGKGG